MTDQNVSPQSPACDRCSVGVMDATNPHLYGKCFCSCHTRSAPAREAPERYTPAERTQLRDAGRRHWNA